MPSTTNTGSEPAKKTHPRRKPTEQQKPEAPAAAPTPPAAPGEGLFDPTPSAPSAAGQPPVVPALPGDAPANGRPEGTDGEQAATPPAAPAPVAPTPAAEDQPEPALDPIAVMAAEHQDDDGEPEAKAEDDQPSSGEPEEVRLGQVTGLLHRLPLGSVLAAADAFAEKIEVLTFSAAVQDLLPRMRASEGRCAPIYFTEDDDGDPEHLIAGDDALSAAKAIDLPSVFVVLIHPGDAGAIHAYLNGKAGTASVSTEDDELVWRAHHADRPASPA